MKADSLKQETLEFTLETLQSTKEFVIEETPLVIQEFYNWEITSSIIWTSVWLAIFIISYFAIKKYKKKDKESYLDDSEEIFNFFAWVGVVSGGLFFIIDLTDLIKIWVAPRVYLIEHISNLI